MTGLLSCATFHSPSQSLDTKEVSSKNSRILIMIKAKWAGFQKIEDDQNFLNDTTETALSAFRKYSRLKVDQSKKEKHHKLEIEYLFTGCPFESLA
jgi:hypothetical protein